MGAEGGGTKGGSEVEGTGEPPERHGVGGGEGVDNGGSGGAGEIFPDLGLILYFVRYSARRWVCCLDSQASTVS